MADPVEEARSLPLEDRIQHQNWKVRQDAYEELEGKYNKAIDSSDAIYSDTGFRVPAITF